MCFQFSFNYDYTYNYFYGSTSINKKISKIGGIIFLNYWSWVMIVPVGSCSGTIPIWYFLVQILSHLTRSSFALIQFEQKISWYRMINGLTMFIKFRTSSIWHAIFLVDTDWKCATRRTPFISALYLALHNHCWVSFCCFCWADFAFSFTYFASSVVFCILVLH